MRSPRSVKTTAKARPSPVRPHADATPTEHGFVSLVPMTDGGFVAVWLDGRGHSKPKIGEFFAQGYSTGRYEGNQLVVDTTKFVFDPTGIDDDFGNMPSSTKKHLVERYYRQGDRLRVDLTIEDALFLLAPVTYTIEWQRSPQPPSLPWECDPDAAKEALKFRTTKYPEPKP